MDGFADELAHVADSTVTRFVEIADKYGIDRNAVVRKAAAAFFEMAFSYDYKTFDIKERMESEENA